MLQELTDVVEVLNQKIIWEHLLAIAPILASGVAIVVSIKTARLQNKIALFEKRYRVVCIFSFLMAIGNHLIECDEAQVKTFLESGMNSYYETSSYVNHTSVTQDYYSFYTGLVLEVAQIKCLFKNKEIALVENFTNKLLCCVECVYKGENSAAKRQELADIYLQIKKYKLTEKMDKSLKLWK